MSFSVQSFQGAGHSGLKGLIARSPPSRLLNLHALRRSPPEDPGYLSRPFFLQPILNRAIVVKHNMRRGEESLEGKRQLNALKLLFPLDADNLSFGARSILTSQYDIALILQGSFESSQPSTERDLKLIGLLDQAPTLDPFLLQEIVRQYGFDIAPCYLAANRQILRHQTAIIAAETNPILEMFTSSHQTTLDVDTPNTKTETLKNRNLFAIQRIAACTLELGEKFSEYFFCWKAVLFYRLRLKELATATNHLLMSVERLRTNVASTQTTPQIERSRRRIYDALASALSEAQLIVDDYEMLHYAVLRSARPDLFWALLRQSRIHISTLGARISRLDDALGFWSAHAPGPPDHVEPYMLESFMEALDRHIATDLTLPTFVRAAPRFGLTDQPISTPVISRLRSDLPD